MTDEQMTAEVLTEEEALENSSWFKPMGEIA